MGFVRADTPLDGVSRGNDPVIECAGAGEEAAAEG
jgi:hypothetical protein